MRNPDPVRQLIKARILAGQLPYTGNYEVFGRKGDGLRCACCDEPIVRPQIEHDVEFSSDLGTLTTLPMHSCCYQAWREVVSALRCAELAVCEEAKARA